MLKSLMAIMLVTSAANIAHAATFNVSGTQVYSIDGFGSTEVVTNPNPQTFASGNTDWQINPYAGGTLSGAFSFADYSISMPFVGLEVNVQNRLLSFSSSTFTFDNSTDPAHPRIVATGITFYETANSVCTKGGLYCAVIPDQNTPTIGDITIIYSDSTLTAFTGVARTFQVIPALDPNPSLPCRLNTPDGSPTPDPADPNDDPATYNLCVNGALTFSGTSAVTTPAVPVPAAAWLLGSGLLGLMGAARRQSRGV